MSCSSESVSDKTPPKTTGISETTKTNIHIKINDMDVNDNLDEVEADSGNIATDLDSDEESQHLDCEAANVIVSITKPSVNETAVIACHKSSRESSEDKSESTSSYIEGATTSYSSDGDTAMKKFSDFIESIDNSLQEKGKSEVTANENRNTVIHNIRDADYGSNKYSIGENVREECNNQPDEMVEALSPNIQPQKNALVENISMKYPTSPVQSSESSPVRPETPKREAPGKPEVKPRLTPPEPPPRKYFTKPAPLNFNANQLSTQSSVINNTRDHHAQQQVNNFHILTIVQSTNNCVVILV